MSSVAIKKLDEIQTAINKLDADIQASKEEYAKLKEFAEWVDARRHRRFIIDIDEYIADYEFTVKLRDALNETIAEEDDADKALGKGSEEI